MRKRQILVGLSTLALAAAMLSVVPSSAAWTDGTYADIRIQAGTWGTPDPSIFECYPVNPDINATCQVTQVRFDFYGNGYRFDFGVTSSSPTPFAWEVKLDLTKEYDPASYYHHQTHPAYTSIPMFPGLDIPPGPPASPWAAWTVRGYRLQNACPVSTSEFPVIRMRGPSWAQVGGAQQWPGLQFGVSALSTVGFPANCS